MSNGSTDRSYRRDQVVSIINSVIHRVSQPQDLPHDVLLHELHDLKQIMEDLRYQLGNTAADSVLSEHIPSAHDELEAVVGATEAATESILGACENILNAVQKKAPDMGHVVETEITGIYEACTFQDITGQRISKVITTLKAIDAKVSGLLNSIGANDDGQNAPALPTHAPSLLNGPALPQGGGLSQDEIDRLLDGM
ncbi:MAG: Chemotaxis protein [Micavibrio sp.]|nr:Chemotaxis protein [Micavibrio sp.]